MKEQLKIEYVSIGTLKPNEYNPKKMTEKEAKDLERSIIEFGIVDPFICNKAEGREGIIIGGHQRYKIYQKLKYQEVPVIWLNIPDIKKEQELCLRLSKNTGSFDYDLLVNFDEDLLKNIGWESEELDKIFQIDIKPEDDEVPEYKQTDIKLGDLFALGDHRLLIGDATKKEDIERLMDGEKADMVFTDPPYGINIVKVGGGGKTHFGKVGGGKWVPANYYMPIIGDDKEFNPQFLLGLAKNTLIFGGNYFAHKLPSSRCWLIWDKTGENYIQNNFADCEIIWTNLEKPSRIYRCKWRGLLKEKGEDNKKRLHPTQKPIKLLTDILKDFSQQNDIVLDLFGGSGSTLIAAEKLNRKCFMME